MKIHSKCFSFLVSLSFLIACGKNSSSSSAGGSTTSSVRSAVAAVGVTSPTAHTTSQLFLPHPQNFFINDKALTAADTELKSFSDFKSDFDSLLASTSVASALSGFSLNNINASPANCYGPSITQIANHPDGSGNSNLPSGDLGIWVSTETQNEACSAAKMNSILFQLQGLVLQGSTLMAGINVAASLSGAGLPVFGDTPIDVTTSVASALSAFTVTSATLQALADVNGFHVYQTTITGTDSNSRPISFTLKHSPTSDDNSTYTGIFYGYMPITNNGNATGFSVIYTKTASTITYLLKSGETQSGTYDGSSLLNSDGTFNFENFQGNAYRILAEINSSTNAGTLYLAWQAGKLDGNTRVFQVTTSDSGSTTTGVAYFGFGPAITTTDGSMTKMICNWAGPGNSHTGISKVQAQVIQKNSTTGILT